MAGTSLSLNIVLRTVVPPAAVAIAIGCSASIAGRLDGWVTQLGTGVGIGLLTVAILLGLSRTLRESLLSAIDQLRYSKSNDTGSSGHHPTAEPR